MQHMIKEQDGATIASLWGDVDMQSSSQLRQILLECVDRGGALLVDLSGVDYMDSSGVACLVESFQNARKKGQGYVLVSVSERVMRVLQLARLDKVFTICDRIDDALAKVG